MWAAEAGVTCSLGITTFVSLIHGLAFRQLKMEWSHFSYPSALHEDSMWALKHDPESFAACPSSIIVVQGFAGQ